MKCMISSRILIFSVLFLLGQVAYAMHGAPSICGSANGKSFVSGPPSSELCAFSPGFASAVTGTGPWYWTCSANPPSVSCSAYPEKQNVVEFFNPALGHYLLLAGPQEILSVERGAAGAGWVRTGAVFTFRNGAGKRSVPVFRFYGSISPGPNSHFYTANPGERDLLVESARSTPDTVKLWNFEKEGGFWAGAVIDDKCTPNVDDELDFSIPVYRLFNDAYKRGLDSNHRFTASLKTVEEMTRLGWVNEGIAFCALAAAKLD